MMKDRVSLITIGILLMGAFVSLVLAYMVQPSVHVDLGSYSDSIYLQGFHDREVDSAGVGREWLWPVEQDRLEIPSLHDGQWIATIYAADSQPGDVFKGLAMSANEQRLTIPRQGGRYLIGIIPPHIAAAEKLVLKLEPGLREGPEPPAGLAGRVVVQPARTYRWTEGNGEIRFPGLGRGSWRIDMTIVTAHPDGQPTNALILANGFPLVTVPDDNALRRVSLLVPAQCMRSGDLNIEIRSHVYRDPRALGILVSNVLVSPMTNASISETLLPPWNTLISVLLIVLMVALCMMMLNEWVSLSDEDRVWQCQIPTKRTIVIPWKSLAPIIVALVLIGCMAWALMNYRFPTTFMLTGLSILACWSMALLLMLRPLLLRIFQGNNSSRFVSTLLLIFFIGYWIKATGMLYPYFVGIDVHWHMDRVRWILDGQLPLLYGPNSPLNETTMPTAEWGTNRPVIPYSPYYHMMATSFIFLPWSLETSANMLSALIDSLYVLLIALLAIKGGLSNRAALFAALIYTLLPVKYLLHSWGNVPTTTGLWWAFATNVCIVVAWEKLHRPLSFAILTLLLMATFLFYTVAGAFMAIFLLCFTCLVIVASRLQLSPCPTRNLLWLWLTIITAVVLVTLLYYGQYIDPMLQRTIPYFAQALTSSAESMGKASDTLSHYLVRHTRLWAYGIVIPLVLTLFWIIDTARQMWSGQTNTLLWASISGWMTLTLIFLFLAYKVSMVDKHFFVIIPCMVIASGAIIDRFWEHRAVRAVTLLWFVYLGVSALQLWLTRIVSVQQ